MTTLLRALGLRDATLLVVSAVIGVGIFLTPGDVARAVPHPGLMLGAWVIGFLLSLAGAFANAELSAMYPQAGGNYVYQREAYHPIAGFLVGSLSFVAVFAGTIATLAVGLAQSIGGRYGFSEVVTVALGVMIVVVTSVLSAQGVRASAMFGNVTTILKVFAMAVLCILGPVFGNGHVQNLLPLVSGAEGKFSGLLIAMPSVLFSYLGWNVSVYVAGEVKDPGKTLPRSLFLGLLICGIAYVAMSAAYLYAEPVTAIAASKRPIDLIATALFGKRGGFLVFVLINVSVLSCLNANVLAGPRILYAMAKDGLFFRRALDIDPIARVPTMAIWIQAAVASMLVIVLRSFPAILTHTTFAIVLATIADTIALYVLRQKNPNAARPYKTWGYPIIPALYIAANGAIGISMLIHTPKACGLAIAELLLAIPIYYAFKSAKSNA